jgi:hypothetical protein
MRHLSWTSKESLIALTTIKEMNPTLVLSSDIVEVHSLLFQNLHVKFIRKQANDVAHI